ncbi:MAG: 5-demethoxyubiquinol-8 5-hydroxylase UbiM [Proteobacteria bacterium]|nr:5-demethoxyubiquinol-8 5-hydroxylase UbiM [Pseudomonadota bacterium]
MDADIVIAGAGPAGLSLAAALAGTSLSVLILERAPQRALKNPAYDGREIALTASSVAALGRLGVLQRIAEADMAPLRSARVFNGSSSHTLEFRNVRDSKSPLGLMVSNAALKRALYEAVSQHGNITLRDETIVTGARAAADTIEIQTQDASLKSCLLVAADTRFSALRASQGIGAFMYEFGKTMLVCRIHHEKPHDGVATEWFGHNQTVAMLPLQDNLSSFVITLPESQIAALMELSETQFAEEVQQRTQQRWGALSLASARFRYPLVAVFAHRFVAPRFALTGDAAVGMHPVTAHGFNLGLSGAGRLAAQILASQRAGCDIADPRGLRRYECGHRRATAPLFFATNALASLYTDERGPARVARTLGLRALNAATPVKHAIETWLSATENKHSEPTRRAA